MYPKMYQYKDGILISESEIVLLSWTYILQGWHSCQQCYYCNRFIKLDAVCTGSWKFQRSEPNTESAGSFFIFHNHTSDPPSTGAPSLVQLSLCQ